MRTIRFIPTHVHKTVFINIIWRLKYEGQKLLTLYKGVSPCEYSQDY